MVTICAKSYFLRGSYKLLSFIGTDNSKVIYTLYGEMARNFTIDRLDGSITPRNTLDFEQIPGPSEENVRQLKLIVRASDLGMPTLFSDVALTIYVQDINDHAPIFEKLFYNVTIPENTSSGVRILQVSFIYKVFINPLYVLNLND